MEIDSLLIALQQVIHKRDHVLTAGDLDTILRWSKKVEIDKAESHVEFLDSFVELSSIENQ